ncbi:MAG TPA: alpha/beta hydrolase [Thermoanaerobaculia bacterium]|nr:alpha/beta hydrolase [Thermoanaerobaculia bacterium]
MSRFLRALFVCLVTTAASAGTFTTYEALEFASPNAVPLLMDLRVPDGPGPHPVIVYLHSGAWIMGDRFGGPAVRQASRGYAVASIEYRLAPQNIWPAPVEDAKAAVRWLRANAARFKLDPNRIGVFGTSSGGHLAAVLGTSGGVPALEGLALGNPQFSSRVQVVIDLYGPTDLLKIEEQKLPCIPLDGNASYMPPSLLMGCPIQSCREWTMTASPMSYVTEDDPKFLIMHGMLDCLVPYQQSVTLHQSLQARGVDSKLVLIPTGDHGGSVFDQAKYQTVVDEFLDTNLRGPVVTARKRRSVR